MPKENMIFCLIVFVAALQGCQSPSVRIAECPPLDVPPMLIEKREPNLTRRLLNAFWLWEEKEIPQYGT